ncbi:hypothetical protein P3T37_003038 [Kitasatospora sp. MAA4]|uniref:hypothetical protein n=1 Tax=Kitasatospora sp. MAA4 TaxID=3035093 RepID=UPI002476A32A|nr:hypothetical protein [Kitasatospora sp. MAA4]MDH6133642.1 hypothetical protein [Kitasatospora sp. MAA4]
MIRRTVRATLVAAACTSVLAAGLTACGAVKQLTAAQKVSDAFGKLGDGKAFSAKLSLDASASQIMAYGTATGEKIEQKNADALSGLGVAVAISSDKPLKELAKQNGQGGNQALDKSVNLSYAVTANGGAPLIEVRQLGATTYLHADAAGIAKVAGQDPAKFQQTAGELPDGLKVVKDVLTGQWVSFDEKTVTDFSKGLAGNAAKGGAAQPSGQPSALPSMDPKTAKNLLNTVKDVLSRNATFEDKGTTDGAEHIVVSAPSRQLANDLLKSIPPVAKGIPGLDKLPGSAPADLPDRTFAVDLFIKNGTVSSIGFDMALLDKKSTPNVHLPVKVAFGTDSPTLQAPSGAVAVTTADLNNAMALLAPKGLGAAGRHTPAAPLTDAQVKELTADGLTAQDIKSATDAGLGYDQIKSLLNSGAGAGA